MQNTGLSLCQSHLQIIFSFFSSSKACVSFDFHKCHGVGECPPDLTNQSHSPSLKWFNHFRVTCVVWVLLPTSHVSLDKSLNFQYLFLLNNANVKYIRLDVTGSWLLSQLPPLTVSLTLDKCLSEPHISYLYNKE